MKKLKLNFQNFSQVETLSRTHMRNVLGGNSLATDENTTEATCHSDADCGGLFCVSNGKVSHCR